MGPLHLLGPLAEVGFDNRFWMTWNLVLAAVPLVLAVPVIQPLLLMPRASGIIHLAPSVGLLASSQVSRLIICPFTAGVPV